MKICTKAKESVQEFAWWTDLPLPVRVSVVISGQIFMLISAISGNCITFVHEFCHHSGGVGRTLPKRCY